jgi:hypothetical protein
MGSVDTEVEAGQQMIYFKFPIFYFNKVKRSVFSEKRWDRTIQARWNEPGWTWFIIILE